MVSLESGWLATPPVPSLKMTLYSSPMLAMAMSAGKVAVLLPSVSVVSLPVTWTLPSFRLRELELPSKVPTKTLAPNFWLSRVVLLDRS